MSTEPLTNHASAVQAGAASDDHVHHGNYLKVWAILVVLLIAVFVRNKTAQTYISPLILVLVVVIVIDAQIIRYQLRKLVSARLPGESTKGLTMYAVMRGLQIRRFRMPAPRVKPGDKI